MANKASILSKFRSMQDLESNNWIILDPLGNIYEIYFMTLDDCNDPFKSLPLLNNASWHMSKRHIIKRKFHVFITF